MELSEQQKLIYRNLNEIFGKESIDEKLICYIGFAPTGQIHV